MFNMILNVSIKFEEVKKSNIRLTALADNI